MVVIVYSMLKEKRFLQFSGFLPNMWTREKWNRDPRNKKKCLNKARRVQTQETCQKKKGDKQRNLSGVYKTVQIHKKKTRDFKKYRGRKKKNKQSQQPVDRMRKKNSKKESKCDY